MSNDARSDNLAALKREAILSVDMLRKPPVTVGKKSSRKYRIVRGVLVRV